MGFRVRSKFEQTSQGCVMDALDVMRLVELYLQFAGTSVTQDDIDFETTCLLATYDESNPDVQADDVWALDFAHEITLLDGAT